MEPEDLKPFSQYYVSGTHPKTVHLTSYSVTHKRYSTGNSSWARRIHLERLGGVLRLREPGNPKWKKYFPTKGRHIHCFVVCVPLLYVRLMHRH